MVDREYYEELPTRSPNHRSVLTTSPPSTRPSVLKSYALNSGQRIYRVYYKQVIEAVLPLKHPNLIAIEDCFTTEDTVCVRLEYAENGNLKDFIAEKSQEKLPESFIQQVLLQALCALAELHKHLLTEVDTEAAPTQQLDHRFICTRNIFLTSENTVKLSELANLALSKTLPLLQNAYHCYQAPEALAGVYSPAADIWSLGVVLYELCTYDVPFKGKNAEEVQESMRNGLVSEVSEGHYSAELREIIREMMDFDPSRRPKATDLLEYRIFQPISGVKWQKWVPKLINWQEMKENRVPIQRKPEEDYPFPSPSLVLPCSSEPISPLVPSATPLSSLRQYLLSALKHKLEPAYFIVKQLFQPSLAAKYSSKPFEDPLKAVLTKEEIVQYLPLLKVLCVREGKGRERRAGRALTDSRLSLSSLDQ